MLVQLDTYQNFPLKIESDYHSASYISMNLDTWIFTNSTEVTLIYEATDSNMYDGKANFEIRFKCMAGLTTENAKFIMPLKEKMSYYNSFKSCDSFGFTNQLYNL